MTSSNNTNTPSSPQKPTIKHHEPKGSASAHAPDQRNHKTYAYTTSLLIALVAISVSIYASYTSTRLQEVSKQTLQTLLSDMTELKQQQVNGILKINSTIDTINKTQEQFQEKLGTLDKNVQAALQQQMYQAKDWLLLKARYYLEMAQINANWSDNVQTTSALLQQADELMANFHDKPSLMVRQSIAKEIATLNNSPKLDLAGLLIKLDKAQAQVAQLPLNPTLTPVDHEPSTPNSPKTAADWRDRLKDSVGLLEKVVVVRHHDEDILPLPSPAYESMLREGIRLNLQGAQWAALQNNEAIYQFSLAQALKNIKRSFEPQAPITLDLVKQLQALQQITIVLKKPSIEESLPLLNQLIESKTAHVSTPSGDNS